MTKTLTTRFEPAEGEHEDACTAILVDGIEVGHISHCYDGTFMLVENVGVGFRFHKHEYHSLAMAMVAAKETFL